MAVVLKLSGDGLNVEREVSLLQAGRIIAFLGSDGSNVAIEEHSPSSPVVLNAVAQQQAPRQSLRELIDQAGATTNAQKIAVFGMYLSQQVESGTFEPENIKSLFPKAGERMPRNFSRDLKDAVSAGYIEELPDQDGVYYITSKGEAGFHDGFGSVTKKSPAKAKKQASSRSASSSPKISESVAALTVLSPDMEGYPGYHKLSTKGLKVMWILAAATREGIDALRPAEISYLADRLRDKIEARDLHGLTAGPARQGWITKDTSANYKLLQKGDDYLKDLANEVVAQ